MNQNLSDKIRQKIKETGIKQAHLAKKLGITPPHLSKILERNQEKYLPKVAEILDIDIFSHEKEFIQSVSVLSEVNLVSFGNNPVTFETWQTTCLPSWPSIPYRDYYIFGYNLKNNVNSKLLKNDIVIFSSCIPLNLNGKVGLAFIKEKSLLFVGSLKYNQGKIMIYNDYDCFSFSINDLLLGVGIYIERNIEGDL